MSVTAGDSELLRSARFRRAREDDWRRLEAVLERAERRGVRSLGFEDARDLATLYRQACTSLSVAREISLDRGLLEYLEALTARAYLAVYAPQETLAGVVGRFVRGAPAALRRSVGHVALAAATLGLGVVVGWLLYAEDPTWFGVFVPGGLGEGRSPASSTADLLKVIYGGADRPLGHLAAFAAFLFSHNTQIALFAFALGVAAGLPTLLLCLYNGLTLGAFVGLHVDRGIGWDLFGWLSIHGVTELAAIAVAGGGGLRLGAAVLFPGRMTRRDALRQHGRDAVKLALLAALMLVVAAAVEGFARQLVTGTEARLAVGWGIGALWLAWFVLGGRRRAPGGGAG